MTAVANSANPAQPASNHIASAPCASKCNRAASLRTINNIASAMISASTRATQVCTPNTFQPPAISQNSSGDLSEYHAPLTVGTSHCPELNISQAAVR